MSKYNIFIGGDFGDGSPKFANAARDGIGCSGFCIMAKTDTGWQIMIHNTNPKEIGEAISRSKELLASAAIADGLHRSDEILKNEDRTNFLEALAGMHGFGD
jgi:hypothetical protein